MPEVRERVRGGEDYSPIPISRSSQDRGTYCKQMLSTLQQLGPSVQSPSRWGRQFNNLGEKCLLFV